MMGGVEKHFQHPPVVLQKIKALEQPNSENLSIERTCALQSSFACLAIGIMEISWLASSSFLFRVRFGCCIVASNV